MYALIDTDACDLDARADECVEPSGGLYAPKRMHKIGQLETAAERLHAELRATGGVGGDTAEIKGRLTKVLQDLGQAYLKEGRTTEAERLKSAYLN
jgi:hypothetical protein